MGEQTVLWVEGEREGGGGSQPHRQQPEWRLLQLACLTNAAHTFDILVLVRGEDEVPEEGLEP